MGLLSRHRRILAETIDFYKSIGEISCPYFRKPITFNSDGFHHLQFSAERERDKSEQLMKFRLLREYSVDILTNSGTIQEYRKIVKVARRHRYSGRRAEPVTVEYWGFVAIVGEHEKERVKIVVRRIGLGDIHFWSAMPARRHKGDESYLSGSPEK